MRVRWCAAQLAERQASGYVGRVRRPASRKSAAVAAAVLEVADATNPPVPLLLGDAAFDFVSDRYRNRLTEWETWERLVRSTDFPSGA